VRVLPHERRPDSLERLDAALFAALGLVAVCARFDGLLKKHGRKRRTSAARMRSATETQDEEVLLALVGLVALRRSCGAHLDALIADGQARRMAAAPAEAGATAPVRGPESARSLLR
jgi:hypothetical protein